ncbi:phage tail tape measure protein [Tsukamurella tyrosinosolvens]|uniref:phage tail tape measure protein n=1 Tax=Tsukamurella tyrosinosolvens TaxID=57704 RepID=UPI003F49B534
MTLDVGTLRATLELAHDEFDGDLDRAQAAFRQLGNTAETQGRRAAGSFSGVGRGVQQETDRAEQAVQRLGQSGEQHGRRLGQGIQQGAASGFRGIAGQAGAAGAQAGESAGGAAAGGMATRIAAAARAGGPIGLAIAGIAAVGAAVGKALADNIIAGMEKQALANKDRAKFGWSEQQAAQVGDAAGKAYVAAFGKSIEENRQTAGTAIQAGLIDGDATAAEIQPVIEKLQVLTEAMGTDVTATAKAAGQMIRNGLVKDASEAFDLLLAAQHKGLNIDGDLLETINEYSTQWRGMGIDGATALGTIQQMMQAGARDTDVAADALKEFRIRVTDVGDKGAKAALESLGLPVDEFRAKIAAGGQEALGASQTIIMALAGVQDQTKRNEIGAALMGTQWEDLAGAINTLDLSKAKQELGDYAGKVDEAKGILGGTASDVESAKRSIEVSMDNIQVKLAEAFGPSLAQAAQWVSEHTEEISRAFEIVGGTIGMVAGALGIIGGTIVGVVGEVIEHTAKLVKGALTPIFWGLEKVGALMAKLPGAAGEVGRGMEGAAAAGRKLLDSWATAGEATSDFGWNMARAGGAVGNASADIAKGTEKAKTATEAFQGLGIKVREVPDEKRIVIEDNSPETKAAIEQLGIKVQTLPDGSIYIDTDDEDAKAKIAELTKPEVKTIVVTTTQAKIGEELAAVNKIRQANGMKPLTAEEFGTGSAGAGVGGTGLSTTGGQITVKVAGGAAKAKPVAPTQVQKTSEELEDEQKAKDKAAAAAKAKADKEQAAAAKKASDAQAKIPGLETALAIAEQKVRELKPNASTSSRMTAEQAVVKAREALTKARADAQGAATTTTSSDDKPVTVTGDGKGGTVQVGTGSNPLQVEPANSAQGDGLRVFVTNMPAGGVGGGIKLSLFANGGVEDHTAQIARGGDMRVWAEPETEGEAYIPLARSKRGRSMGILRQVAARFGQRLTAFDNGGIVPNAGVTGGTVQFGNVSGAGITTQEQQDAWDAIRQAFPGASLNSATRTQDVGSGFDFHMAGEAIDIGGSPELMMQIAEWIASNYPNSRELIHGPGFAKQIKNGKIVGDGGGDYGFYAGAGRHDDHVHWTPPSGFTFGGGAAVVTSDGKALPLGAVGLTADSSREDVAKAIIGEGRKRGYSDEEIRAILATALGESNLEMQNNPAGWNGFFQQDDSYANRNDPNGNIIGFFDELDKGSKDSKIWQRIVGVQQHHDANYTGETSGDMDYMSKMTEQTTASADLFDKLAGSIPMGTTGASTTTGTGTKPTTTTGTGGTQNVYVTGGKLDSVGTGGGSQYKFSLFANGGIEDHTAHITDKLRVFGEPETGGEAYIPLAASKRARSLAIWRRTGQLLGVQGYAGGGINIAPKIEAPKITPTVGPGMALPIPAATPAVGTTGGGFDPLAILGLSGNGAGVKQDSVPGTGETVTPQQRDTQRAIQMGGDLAKIGVQALKEILLPSGVQSSQAENVLGLVKSVGQGISSSAEKKTSSKTETSVSPDGTRIRNSTYNFYTQDVDEAYRRMRTHESIQALGYDGSLNW